MAKKREQAQVDVILNDKKANASIKEMEAAANKLRREVRGLNTNTKEFAQKEKELKKITGRLREIKGGATATGKAMQTLKGYLPIVSIGALVAGIGRLGKGFLDLSKRLEGENRRANIVFGESLNYVEQQADQLAKKMGVTNHEFVAMASATADLLIPLDFTRQQAAEMSVELQGLTGALDEWTSGSIGAKEISEILTKAMLGENEQLKRLGIAIRKDTDEYRDLVKQKMAAGNVTKAQAEAMATLELIQKKSADAQAAYNQEGNKLLRIQKEIGRRWRQMKENIVGYFDVDPVKKIEMEREALNKAAIEVSILAENDQDRIDKIKELQNKYPGFLANMDAEKVTNEELNEALSNVNEEYVKKITLANMDKEQMKATAKYAKEKNEYNQQYNKILKNMSALYIRVLPLVEKYNENIKGQKIDWANYEKAATLEEKYFALYEISSKVLGMGADTQNIIKWQFQQLESQKQLVDEREKDVIAIQDQIKIMEELLDINKQTGGQNVQENKKNLNELLKLNKENYQEQRLMILQSYTDQKIDKANFDAEMLILEMAYLEQKKILQQQANDEGWKETQEKILQRQISLNEQLDGINKEKFERIHKEEEAELEEYFTWTENQYKKDVEIINKYADEKLDKFIENELKKKKIVEETEKEIFALTKDFSNATGAMFVSVLSGNEEAMKDSAKNFMLIILKSIKIAIQGAVAQAVGLSYAQLDSVMSFGATGTIRAAILTGLIEGAFSVFENAVRNTEFFIGGSTGPGRRDEPAGIVHRGEYVVSQPMLQDPVINDFVTNYAEPYRLRTLSINPKALSAAGIGNGFASGGSTSPGTIQTSQYSVDMSKQLDQNNKIMNGVYNLLIKLHDEGVNANFDQRKIKDMRDAISEQESIENDLTK